MLLRFDEDLVSLLRKRCYDLAGTSGVAVYWNGTRLPVKNFSDYVDLYLGESSSRKKGSKRKRKKNSNDDDGGSSNSESETGDASLNNPEEDRENDKPEKPIVKIHEKMHRWEVVISQSGNSWQA